MFEKYKPVYREDYTKWIKTQKDEIAKIAKDPKRLTYHLMPEKGWLNDPNGLCQFKGIYHILKIMDIVILYSIKRILRMER